MAKMIKTVFTYFLFTTVLLLFSCKDGMQLNKEDLFAWIENEKNGLTKHHIENKVDFTATYCNKDYLIAKEIKVDEIKEENFNTRIKDFNGFEYFKIRIKRSDSNQEVLLYGLNNEGEYLERVNYLSYGFEENLALVRNNFKDTIYPSLYHFERTYGVVPYADIMVSFTEDTTVKDNNYKLIINDNVFGNGLIIYDFDKKKLNTAPKLKLY